MAGFLTPSEPGDRTHVFFRYCLEMAPDKLGLDMPVEQYTAKVRAALAAEGVELGRGEFVIPAMTLFHEKQGYGKGCPWTCGHYRGSVQYDPLEYPVALDAIKRVFALIGLTPPNGRGAHGPLHRGSEEGLHQPRRSACGLAPRLGIDHGEWHAQSWPRRSRHHT